MSPQRRRRGFTLVETLVVLAVALILLVSAAPSLHGILQRYRLTAASNELLSAIHTTRSEALHRGQRVDLAAVNDDWSNGWTVFVDRNRDRLPDAGDNVILRHPAPAGEVIIESTLLDNSGKYLSYDAHGRSRTEASRQQPQFGTIRIRAGDHRRNIVINMLGRPRVCAPAPGADSC